MTGRASSAVQRRQKRQLRCVSRQKGKQPNTLEWCAPVHTTRTAELSSLLTIRSPRAPRLQMGELKLKESLLTELKSTVLKLQAENASLEQVRHNRYHALHGFSL